MRKRYWPFEVSAQEQGTPTRLGQVQFLAKAYQDGYHPYLEGGDFVATNADKRAGTIIARGSKSRWEVVLSHANEKAASAFVDDFCCAANAVLRWLGGDEVGAIIAECKGHLVVPPGAVLSHVIYVCGSEQSRP